MSFCGGKDRSPFEGLTLSTFNKVQRANQVYPIFVDIESECIVGVGLSLQDLIDKGLYSDEKENFEYSCDNIPGGTWT